ncbi:MAG: WG repeat-containing protein [Pyrinomonadaceae bacterium]
MNSISRIESFMEAAEGFFGFYLQILEYNNMRLIFLSIIFSLLIVPCLAYEPSPLFVISVELRFGFIDRDGNIIIKPQYFEARDFSEGLAAVRNDKNQWGYIDKSGKVIVDFRFASAGDFSEGLARIQIKGTDAWNGLTGYIDKKGRMVIKPRFVVNELKMPEFGYFSEGLAVFEKDNKMGFIDRSGKVAIEAKYDAAHPFSEGLANVAIGQKWGFIDRSGRQVIPLEYDYGSAPEFSEGLAGLNRNDDRVYVNKTGEVITRFPNQAQWNAFANNFSEGLVCWVEISGKMGYRNTKGEMVIPPIFDYAEEFSEGLAAVEINGQYGFIDRTGTMVIEPLSYLYLPKFKNGLAQVVTRDFKFGYINQEGQFVWPLSK